MLLRLACISRPKRVGRQRTVRSIRALVLRLARENSVNAKVEWVLLGDSAGTQPVILTMMLPRLWP